LEYIGAKRDPTLSDGHGGDEQQILQDRVLSTLLNEMDGVDTLTMNAVGSDQVFVLGCCSDPAIIDEALIRAGRLGKRIYIPPPSAKDRQEIIDLCLRKHCSPEQCQLFEAQSLLKQVMVELTEGQTGADIDLLIRYVKRYVRVY
jgi:SpoVK/Ycf46/Vps4 family AAA+-type ATPase